MPAFPNPQFLKDKESDQFLCFAIFIRKLKENFIALSPEAENDLIRHVSDLCEAFYQYERSTNQIELLNKGLFIDDIVSPLT